MRGFIYKLTNPIGQYYIGQTKNLDNRMQRYKDLDCKSQKLIYTSLVRYGFENHKLEILKRCALSKMDFLGD
jgi:group I intron endonuclease